MYKHMASSIKETDEKMFLSQTDIDKYNNYGKVLMDKNDSYNKEEMEVVINEANKHYILFEGEMSNIKGTSTGQIKDVEVFGNTNHRVEEIFLTPELETGGLSIETGQPIDGSDSVRTKYFISVKYGDEVEYFNTGIQRGANVLYYNNERFIKHELQLNGRVNVPFGCNNIKIYHNSNDSDNISMKITRTHLSDIQSVGRKLDENRYELELVSCGKNLFNGELSIGDIDINTGNVVGDIRTHVVSKEFMQVENNTSYTLCAKDLATTPKWISVFLYDSNFNYLGYKDSGNIILNFDTTKDVRYVKFKIENPSNVVVKVQLEKGERTEYEPYKQYKYSIILPVELDKIDKYSDRLFKREDGKWCIEKNIKDYILDGSEEGWATPGSYGDWEKGLAFAYCIFNDMKISKDITVISNKFKSDRSTHDTDASSRNYEFIAGYIGRFNGEDKNWIYIKLNTARLFKPLLTENTSEENNRIFTDYLKENNIRIKYITKVPEIIELPLETQIILNSFEGVTNVFSTNTPSLATLKGSVPATIATSMETITKTTKDLYDRVEKANKLKSGSSLNMESDNGLISIDKSIEGVIDDIKIEGETLINLVNFSQWLTPSGELSNTTLENKGYLEFSPKLIKNLEKGKKYTLFIDVHYDQIVNSNIYVQLNYIDKDNNVYGLHSIRDIVGNKVAIETFTVPDNYHKFRVGFIGLTPNSHIKNLTTKCMVIEGDHTNKPLSYFEGIKSVGDGVDKIEVKSRKDNGNLFNGELSVNLVDTTKGPNFGVCKYVQDDVYHVSEDFIEVSPNTTYIAEYNGNRNDYKQTLIFFYDNTKQPISYIYTNTDVCKATTPINCKYVLLRFRVAYNDIPKFKYIFRKVNSDLTDYKKPMSKQLMYLDSEEDIYKKPILRGLPFIKDTVEKYNDGKWYYHERCGEFVIDGTEDWSQAPITANRTTSVFHIPYDIQNISSAYGIGSISNLLPLKYVWDIDEEGYWLDTNGMLYVSIYNSKLSSSDVVGFKSFLTNNNMHIVYKRKLEIIHECSPLHLDTFEDETLVMLNSGCIPGKLSLSVNTYVGSVVSILKDRVSKLEDVMFSQDLFRNKMMLFNTYNADSTSLKVDINTASESIVNDIDTDLYELILKIVLTGKDNYDRVEIETIIDFYTMIGSLSYELADGLFYLIEQQNVEMIEEI